MHRLGTYAWVMTVIATLMVLVGTLTPPSEMPKDIPGSDKLHHFLGFMAVVLPVCVVYPRSAIWLVPAATGLGILIEFLQPLVGRGFSVGDMVANGFGTLAGGVAGWILHRPVKRAIALARR